MDIVLSIIPLILSSAIGILFTNHLFYRDHSSSIPLNCILGIGLGLGISAFFSFLSFVLLNQWVPVFVIGIHLCTLAFLIYYYKIRFTKIADCLTPFARCRFVDFLPLIILMIFCLPLSVQASYYPFGGWDAWSVWNLKARFLLLGAEHWQMLFDPLLWRSSPHYPLLLPLMVVWGWAFVGKPVFIVHLGLSVLFTYLSVSLLFLGIKKHTGTLVGLIISAALITIPLFFLLGASQYSDILFGYYLLASLLCLIKTKENNTASFALLAGLLIGLMSFTKTEGFLAALLISGLSLPYLKSKNKGQKNPLKSFFIGLIITLLPSLLYSLFMAPENITFLNGLTSAEKPVTLIRLKTILNYYGQELIAEKWQGIWIILLMAAGLSHKHLFSKHLMIIPLFLAAYFLALTAYYLINTHFEINWWLQVTLHRLLFALLPVIVFWIISALWQGTN